MRVLVELTSSDTRMGAVNDILDLAHYAGSDVRYFLCGVVDDALAALARAEHMTIVPGRSQILSRRGAIPYVLNVLGWVLRLWRIRPDVVHLNYAGHAPSLACAARICRIPVVSRATSAFDPRNLLNRWTSAYVANCDAHAGVMLESPLAHRVRVTGDLFRPDRLRRGPLERPLPSRTGRPRFVFLGQLVERKGVDVLVRAFARLEEDAELLLVGGDWSDKGFPATLRRLIAEGAIQDRVYCENHRTDVAELLHASDVLVLPSLSEARPRVIIEAMCAGRPVIATAVGGVPEMVKHGETGLLVPPNDVPALAEALDSLARSASERARMGEAAQRFALDAFHPERTVARYVELYRELAFG